MIKNRTSYVPVEKTIAEIEAILIEGGACGTERIYRDRRLKAIRFSVLDPGSGKTFKVNLEADEDALFRALSAKVKRPRNGTLDRIREQALRTAWRLELDRLEIEMTRIELGKVHFLKVFLSDLWDGRMTFFERILEGGLKMLPSGTDGQDHGG